MNHTQRGIAVLHGVHDDPNREKIIDLIHGLVLVHHLLVDAEKVLDAAVNSCLNAGLLYGPGDVLGNLLDVVLPLRFPFTDLLDQLVVNLRPQVPKRKIVQLYLDFADAETGRNRRIDVQRLLCNALLFLRRLVLERAHIVQTVRQLDQDDTDVLDHGQKHFAQILGLHLLLGLRLVRVVPGKLDLFELRHTVHQLCDIAAEGVGEVLLGIDRILHHVVQKPGCDRFLVHLQIRQNNGNVQRMNDVRLTALTLLPLVRLIGQLISLLDHGKIFARVISAHANQQIPIKLLRT